MKLYENVSETEWGNAQSTEIQKMFDLIKQIEELLGAYGAKKFEMSDIEILEKVWRGYHAA